MARSAHLQLAVLALWACGRTNALQTHIQPAVRHHMLSRATSFATLSSSPKHVRLSSISSKVSCCRSTTSVMSGSVASVGIGMALDVLGAGLKLAWRAVVVFLLAKIAILGKAKMPASVLQSIREVVDPRKVAQEKREAAAALEEAERKTRMAEVAKKAQEEAAAEQALELQRAAEAMKKEEEEAERRRIEGEKRLAAREQEKKEREERLWAEKLAEEQRKAEAAQRLQKLKEQANKLAEEEANAAAEAKAAAEKAEAERLAAIEAAKTPEQRAAEAEAAAAAEAERQAQIREEQEAALEAAATAAATAATTAGESSMPAIDPVGAGYVHTTTSAVDASVITMLSRALEEAGRPLLLSTSNLHQDMRSALIECVTELEASYTPTEDADAMRADMLGFWKLLCTADDTVAASGLTGFGAQPRKSILGQYVCYTKPDEYEPKPTLQTVEVVADHKEGRAVVAALKGDFFVGKLASTGALGVVDDFTKKEYDNNKHGDGSSLQPLRWSCGYAGNSLRVVRSETGAMFVYGKCDASQAQAEIEELLASPVMVLEAAEGEELEEVDDRPGWQKRLDEFNSNEAYDRFGPPGQSDIP